MRTPPLPGPVRLGAFALSLVLLGSTAMPAAAQSAAELRALRAQMEEMARRIAELEAQQAQTAATAQVAAERPVVGAGSRPGSIRLPGSETDVVFGGYIKTDFIYDTNEALGDLFVPENITTSNTGDDPRFRAHARQSRVFLRTFTPTDFGELTSWLELDLFGSGGNEVFSNSTEPRLRHAVVGLGGFLIGQTWSNFQPIESARDARLQRPGWHSVHPAGAGALYPCGQRQPDDLGFAGERRAERAPH